MEWDLTAKIKTMKQVSHGGFLLVEVEPDAELIHIYKEDGENELTYWYHDGKLWFDGLILPKGNYQIVGLAKDLTEEQWEEIVERDGFYYIERDVVKSCWKDYRTNDENLVQFSATESGHSLVKSHGFQNNNCLILKRFHHL